MTSLVTVLLDGWRLVLVHFWQTTLVVVPILVATTMLKRTSSRVLHALWLLAFAKLLLPLAILGGISSWLARLLLGEVSAASGGSAVTTIAVVRAVLDPAPGHVPAGAAVATALAALTIVWVILALRRARRLLNRPRIDGIPLTAVRGAAAARVREAARRAGIPAHTIRLAETGGAHVTGVRRPTIVLSRALVHELADDELDAALLHEDAHRRRREPLRAFTVELTRTLAGVYPLLGPIVQGLRRTAELVCDADAIARGACPNALARAVARSVLHATPVRTPHAVALGGDIPLRERVERIHEPERYRSMRSHRLTLAALALAAMIVSFTPVPFLAGCASSEEQTPTEATNDVATTFDTPPVVKAQIPAQYPQQAKEQGLSGKIFVKVTLDTSGNVTDAVVEKRSNEQAAIFDEAALTAAKGWTFEPAKQDDVPVRCQIVIPFSFQLH